jgi:hypothetical protein
LLALMMPAFTRTEAWLQARRSTAAVMSDVPRRNGWTIAKVIGDRTPDRTPRLLSRASWDEAAATGAVRRFAVAGWMRRPAGPAAAGACAPVLCPRGYRARADRARQWIPQEHIADPVRSLLMALPLTLEFATKGQLAKAIVADTLADGVHVDFVSGDEVYGSCTQLRDYLEEQDQTYMLRVPSSFRVTSPAASG